MASTGELACVYSSLILADGELDVTADNISKLIQAAGVEAEPYWPGLFAQLFEKKSVNDFITSVGAGGGGGGGGAPAAGGGAAEAGEAPKEAAKEEEEEEDEDMGFSLFD